MGSHVRTQCSTCSEEDVARRSSLQQCPSMREVSSKLYHGACGAQKQSATAPQHERSQQQAVPWAPSSCPRPCSPRARRPVSAVGSERSGALCELRRQALSRRDLFPHGGAERRICTFEVVRRRIYENIVRATCTSVTVMLSVGMSADQAEPHHVTLCSTASHPFSGAL